VQRTPVSVWLACASVLAACNHDQCGRLDPSRCEHNAVVSCQRATEDMLASCYMGFAIWEVTCGESRYCAISSDSKAYCGP